MQKMPLPLLPQYKFAALLFGLTSCDDTIYEGYSAFRAEDLHIEGKKIEQSPFHSQSR